MKRLEAEMLISKKLENRNLYFQDAFNKRYKVTNYDEFINLIMQGLEIYKNDIPEYEKMLMVYLDKMNVIVEKIMEFQTDDLRQIENSVDNLMSTSFPQTSMLNCILPGSFTVSLESNETAIKQIYAELGYESLRDYIELIKSPSRLNSYLGDSSKQLIAMHYIFYKTGHHSNARIKRNNTQKTLIQETVNHINSVVSTVAEKKEDYVTFVDEQKQEISSWFNASNEEFKKMMEDGKNQIVQLEETYEEKLKVEKPADFMKKQSLNYAFAAVAWSVCVIVLSVIVVLLLNFILSPSLSIGVNTVTINLFSEVRPIYSGVIVTLIISIIVYLIRVFIKLVISSKHLSDEYSQKYALTYFYLALIKDGKINDETKNAVLITLFNKADTGLIKNDSVSDLVNILSLYNNK